MENESWLEVRREFHLDPDLLHFGAFWLSSYPAAVRRLIDHHRHEIDRNPVFYIMDNEERLEKEARTSIADFIGAVEDRIVLTGSTTEGLALAVGMLRLGPDDEVLTTTHEHYSAYSAVRLLEGRLHHSPRVISLYDDPGAADKAAMVAAIMSAVTEATRLVVVTWVHSGTGVRIPLIDIAQAIAMLNEQRPENDRILLCVDATHAFGVLRIDLRDLECDIFISSCHKWLNGPHGTGFVYFSKYAVARAQELTPSFAPGPLGRFTGRHPRSEGAWERLTPGGFHAYEHRWSIVAAVEFARSLGIGKIERRICGLASRLKQGMVTIPGVRLVTPVGEDLSAGIVCFELDGLEPEETVAELRSRRVVASVSPYRIRYARLTPGIYNLETDVDRLIERLFDLAHSRRAGRRT
jgi:isopenicillin-N epimerase